VSRKYKRLDDVAPMSAVIDTQMGITQFAEAAAKYLAEAGRASSKAIGDDPEYAVRQWSNVIRDKAIEILREENRKTKRLT